MITELQPEHIEMIRRGFPERAVRAGWWLDNWPGSTDKEKLAEIKAGGATGAWGLAEMFGRDHDAFLAAHGRGLALYGDTGRGKTSLAVGIGWALLAGGYDVRFADWRSLVADAYEAIGKPGSGASTRRRDLARAGVLILDDVGDVGVKKEAPAYTRTILQEVIWPREAAGLPTVVTTNCRIDDLEAQFGGPAVGRLYGMMRWVRVDGSDLRRRTAA